MSKRYSTILSNGHKMESSSAHEASNWTNYDVAQTFSLSGKSVTAEAFYAAVQEAVGAAWEKKNQTHKRVTVRHGSSAANYITKWARR